MVVLSLWIGYFQIEEVYRFKVLMWPIFTSFGLVSIVLAVFEGVILI